MEIKNKARREAILKTPQEIKNDDPGLEGSENGPALKIGYTVGKSGSTENKSLSSMAQVRES